LENRNNGINTNTINKYLAVMQTEINPSKNYETSTKIILTSFSKFHNNKPFSRINRDNIITFLNSFRKSEKIDPLHKWIGTYNRYLIVLTRFFRWLDNPTLEPKQRPKPGVVHNIQQLRRREQSIYKPTDLWTRQDDLLLLKHCPSIRDKCYHTISRDLSARPDEILGLKIKDIIFKNTRGKQYAECLVNGKTGTRHLPLIDSLPYLKDWLDQHPQRNNHNSYLICSMDRKNFAGRMTRFGIRDVYTRYRSKFFPKLLESPDISVEDKEKIRELLKKPWNLYIRRHSALTEKSKFLRESTLRQHAGWSPRSQMHQKYVHYFGNESNNSILQEYGILPKDNEQLDVLKPKQCPNCNEPNRPDNRFCTKCSLVLSYDAYNETLEEQKKKEDKLAVMEDKFNAMQSQIQALITTLANLKDQGQIDQTAQILYNSGIIGDMK
jgi:integrase/recombinase XerD